MRRRQPRPPKRRCPGCGGDYYAWSEGGACRACLKAGSAPIIDFGNLPAGGAGELHARRRAAIANHNLDHDDIPY